MALGDLTTAIVECSTPAAIITAIDALSTGAATAGADITSVEVVPVTGKVGWLVISYARAAA